MGKGLTNIWEMNLQDGIKNTPAVVAGSYRSTAKGAPNVQIRRSLSVNKIWYGMVWYGYCIVSGNGTIINLMIWYDMVSCKV